MLGQIKAFFTLNKEQILKRAVIVTGAVVGLAVAAVAVKMTSRPLEVVAESESEMTEPADPELNQE